MECEVNMAATKKQPENNQYELLKLEIIHLKELFIELNQGQNQIDANQKEFDDKLSEFSTKLEVFDNRIALAIRDWINIHDEQEVIKLQLSNIEKMLIAINNRFDLFEQARKEEKQAELAAKKRRNGIIIAIITAGGSLLGVGIKLIWDYFENNHKT